MSKDESQEVAEMVDIYAKDRRHFAEILTKMNISTRESQIIHHRMQEPPTAYRQIASAVGLSTERVRQLFFRHVKLFHKYLHAEVNLTPLSFDELSVRTQNCLFNSGIVKQGGDPPKASEVRQAVLDGRVSIGAVRNFGRKSFLEVCDWVGIDPASAASSFRWGWITRASADLLTRAGYRRNDQIINGLYFRRIVSRRSPEWKRRRDQWCKENKIAADTQSPSIENCPYVVLRVSDYKKLANSVDFQNRPSKNVEQAIGLLERHGYRISPPGFKG